MSKTPKKVRASRELFFEHLSSLRDLPEKDISVLQYSPSGEHFKIPTKKLVFENANYAVFDKRQPRASSNRSCNSVSSSRGALENQIDQSIADEYEHIFDDDHDDESMEEVTMVTQEDDVNEIEENLAKEYDLVKDCNVKRSSCSRNSQNLLHKHQPLDAINDSKELYSKNELRSSYTQSRTQSDNPHNETPSSGMYKRSSDSQQMKNLQQQNSKSTSLNEMQTHKENNQHGNRMSDEQAHNETKSTMDDTGTRGNNLSEFLCDLWQSQRLCDIILKVNGSEFLAHKVALAACSDKFTNRCCQYSPNTISEVILSNVSPEAAKDMLRFIYTNELSVSVDNVEPIIQCARQLGIKTALKHCVEFLYSYNNENVLRFLPIAERQGLTDVVEDMKKFISKSAVSITESPGLMQCSLERMRWFLSRDDLAIPNELYLFFTALKWIDFDRHARLQHAPIMMGCIRFIYITPHDLVQEVEPVHYIFNIKKCSDMLYFAYRYHSLLLSGSKFVEMISIPSPRHYGNDANQDLLKSDEGIDSAQHNSNNVSFIQKDTGHHYCKTYSFTPEKAEYRSTNQTHFQQDVPFVSSSIEKTFTTNPQLPHNNINLTQDPPIDDSATSGVLHINEKLISNSPPVDNFLTIGGINPFRRHTVGDFGRNVEEYNPTLNTWTSRTSLPFKCHHTGACMLDGFIYVIGGSIITKVCPNNLSNPTDVCFRYDPKVKTWSRISSLQQARMYHGTAVLDRLIYAIAGHDFTGRSLDSVEYYSPETDRWESAAAITEPKLGIGCAAFKGRLYVVGGAVDRGEKKVLLNTVECYDPNIDCWVRKHPLPYPCCHCNVLECKGALYLIGGAIYGETGNDIMSTATILQYNDKTDSWIEFSHMMNPRHDAGAVAIGYVLFVVIQMYFGLFVVIGHIFMYVLYMIELLRHFLCLKKV